MTATPLALVVGETVPHGELEHWTDHVTPLFAGSPVTVAVNCAEAPGCTVTLAGITEIIKFDVGTVTVAEPIVVESAAEIAATVTVRLPCWPVGAV